jgi:hypothetical protein
VCDQLGRAVFRWKLRDEKFGNSQTADYRSSEGTVDSNVFKKKLFAFVRQHNHSIVLSTEVQDALFEICTEFRQTVNGFFERDRVLSDYAASMDLCHKIVRELSKVRRSLHRSASDLSHPQTSQIAKLAASQLAAVHKRVEHVAEEIDLQTRLNHDMQRLARRKHATYEFVSDLDDYISQVYPANAFLQKDRNIVLAGAMFAAGEFTPEEVRGDVLARIPQKRFNAREYITEKYIKRGIPMVAGKGAHAANRQCGQELQSDQLRTQS